MARSPQFGLLTLKDFPFQFGKVRNGNYKIGTCVTRYEGMGGYCQLVVSVIF